MPNLGQLALPLVVPTVAGTVAGLVIARHVSQDIVKWLTVGFLVMSVMVLVTG
ncbi:MAG: hypothetical protein AAGF59_07450 [Pseudomonadota bacterium]